MVSRQDRNPKRYRQIAKDATSDVLDVQSIERRLRGVGRWRYPSWQEWIGMSESDLPPAAGNKPPPSRSKAHQIASQEFTLARHKESVRPRRSLPSWGISLGIHGLLITCLALLSFADKELRRDERTIFSPAAHQPVDSPVLLATPFAMVSPQQPQLRETEHSSPGLGAAATAPRLPRIHEQVNHRSHLLADVETLFRSGDISATATSASGPQSNSTHFFGVPGDGSRFVFVVDSSRSMMGSDFSGRPWKDAQHELQLAISRLGPTRQFYVIFFDGEAHLMFDETPASMKMLHASSQHVTRFTEWMANVDTGFNTSPLQAVKCALSLRPDVIYLLSDGDFRDQTARYLKKNNRRMGGATTGPFTSIVHTIGFHNRAAQRVLRNIAKGNGGTYKFVPDPFITPRLTRAQ